jgi:hypothetical protein
MERVSDFITRPASCFLPLNPFLSRARSLWRRAHDAPGSSSTAAASAPPLHFVKDGMLHPQEALPFNAPLGGGVSAPAAAPQQERERRRLLERIEKNQQEAERLKRQAEKVRML